MALNIQISEVKKAISGSGGIVSTIASRLKCDWHTADKYIKKYDLQEDVRAEKESLLDFAESQLLANIKNGDTTSILFYLKTQGKKRGYIERQEVENSGSQLFIIVPPNLSDET